MEKSEIDYMVGLSPSIRSNVRPSRVCELVRRAIDGDPGDAENPEAIMETISAHMCGLNSCHFFNGENPLDESVFVLLKPADQKVMVLGGSEMGKPEIQLVMEAFGFNGSELTPMFED